MAKELDKTMIMHSRAEEDTPRHSTVQNGTARVSTHDSTTDVCAGVGGRVGSRRLKKGP